MLQRVAEGVFVHQSEFIQSNSTVVLGRDGVLLTDPGITSTEMNDLADDLHERGWPVVAGFSTHPDWDHVLWHDRFGEVPRYGTSPNATSMQELLARPDWEQQVTEGLPPEYIGDIPMHLLGRITALPEGAAEIPWHGPRVRIIEHRAHAVGHAALLVEPSGVLVAGDMLSDILMPFLDLEAGDPIGDYLAALRLFDDVAGEVDAVIPGHGSVGGAGHLQARIQQDRTYAEALRDGGVIDDVRVGPSAPLDWLPDVHKWQAQQFAEKPGTAR
jgi:glyoxylase-like metal-dependent hydrolase (beta-lactamase superfamily II)